MTGVSSISAREPRVKIGITPSFIFLPVVASEQLDYFKAEGVTAMVGIVAWGKRYRSGF